MMTHTPGMALNERPKTLTAPMGVGRQCAHTLVRLEFEFMRLINYLDTRNK